MKINGFILLLPLFFLNYCGESLTVAEIEKGQRLETAKETSVNEFFIKRMSNKTRKTESISWQILFKTSEFVYYGFPKSKSENNESRTLDSLFKVNRKALETIFPGYETISGESVGYNLYLAIEEYKKKTDSSAFEIASLSWNAALTDENIFLTVTCIIKSSNKQVQEKFLIEFDKKTFDILKTRKMD